jgi:hypothetical protein
VLVSADNTVHRAALVSSSLDHQSGGALWPHRVHHCRHSDGINLRHIFVKRNPFVPTGQKSKKSFENDDGTATAADKLRKPPLQCASACIRRTHAAWRPPHSDQHEYIFGGGYISIFDEDKEKIYNATNKTITVLLRCHSQTVALMLLISFLAGSQ